MRFDAAIESGCRLGTLTTHELFPTKAMKRIQAANRLGAFVMLPVHRILMALAVVVLLGITSSRAEEQITRPEVSESASPVEVVAIPVPDGPKTPAVVRKPPGKGPFPAIIHLHGGLEPWPMSRLKEDATKMPTSGRFLAAGYVLVIPTFRARSQDPQTKDALIDCLAVVDYVKKMPEVDPKSIVIWGNSGGGSLALEIAGETSVCAIVAEEPATVLFSGMYTKESLGGKPPFTSSSGSGHAIMNDPKKYYTPELQEFTKAKIAKIGCPVFIAYGGTSKINKINTDIIIPELKEAGKDPQVILYPNQPHGFSKGGSPAALKFFNDVTPFLMKHLPTKPKALEASLVKTLPIENKRKK
jgi:acetyl esterase/lipase